ncbi:hypothetical protein [Streptomyces decoyicus]|uniref:hypothetical protein n=1 Tax=Streptomyces decoyicus TaxID=249567 RepID=UPI003825C0F7
MVSVLGLLAAEEAEVREKAEQLRAEAERITAELAKAESLLARLVDARELTAGVLTRRGRQSADDAGTSADLGSARAAARLGRLPGQVARPL